MTEMMTVFFQSFREQVVPVLVAILVYGPLAYLWATGQEVTDAHIGLAGLIAGYYFNRATANGSAREVAALAAEFTARKMAVTEVNDAAPSAQ